MPRTASREEPPVYVLTREAARELDRLALCEFGLPTLLLMENAARNAADIALDGLEGIASPRVIIIAGPGNNGGDGLAMARHLHNAGLNISIILAARPKPGSAAALHLNVCERIGLHIHDASASSPETLIPAAAIALGGCDLIIDAMIGTGLARPLEGTMAALAAAINTFASRGKGCDVLSLDCPSGMDCETGEAATTASVTGAAVRASVTVSFAGLKPGFLTLAAQTLLGEVVVADIGVPRALLERLGTRIAGRPTATATDPEAPPPPRGRARSRD